MNRTFLLLIFVLAFTCSGCTARYSQSLAGSIPNEQGSQVSSRSAGFTLFSIALSEPSSAAEQVIRLMHENNCNRMNLVEIDYRELLFPFFGIPKVKVTGTCVK